MTEFVFGQNYRVTHKRKGTFIMRVDSADEVKAYGVVVDPLASAIQLDAGARIDPPLETHEFEPMPTDEIPF